MSDAEKDEITEAAEDDVEGQRLRAVGAQRMRAVADAGEDDVEGQRLRAVGDAEA